MKLTDRANWNKSQITTNKADQSDDDRPVLDVYPYHLVWIEATSTFSFKISPHVDDITIIAATRILSVVNLGHGTSGPSTYLWLCLIDCVEDNPSGKRKEDVGMAASFD